ncbi:phage tail tape measure protein [Agrobacterium pusense]|uniref:phage tail tape measure protein n=2 Tax=Agrobacterium pusense TaxID=648995 RepID=UPI001AECDC5D|nr:phage tail tape measure protein [Agrobacterium pusense]
MARTSAAALSVLARFGGPAAIAAGAIYATKQAGDFEQALFNIQKKSGATTKQMADLREEILSLSKVMPVSMDEITSAFERGAAAGVPLGELRDFARLSSGVADAWDTTAENVSNTFAGFVAGMGMQRKDLEAFASLINDLADSGIADETGIADFIDRAGASLKNFGMTPEEVAAYGAALLNLKMPAEVAARAMDTVSGKLLAPENLSPKSSTALKAIVGDLDKFAKMSGNTKMVYFLQQVEKLSSQRRASLLGALLGEGFDDEIMRLVAGSEELRRNLKMARDHVASPSNSIADAQAKKFELFNSQLLLLRKNMEDVFRSAGEKAIMPWLSDAIKQVNDAIADMDTRRKAVKGQSSEQIEQDHEKFVNAYMKDNPSTYGSMDLDRANADRAYREALKQVGEGKIVDVHEYNIQRRQDKAYQERVKAAKEQYAAYGQGRAGVNNLPEFPGGGTGLPPIPTPRPSIDPEHFRVLRENYAAYGEGRRNISNTNGQRGALNQSLTRDERRQRLREADPASLGMEGMGGVLIESSRQIESSGAAAGRSMEDGAASVKQAGESLLSSLLNVARQIDAAAAKLQSVKFAGTTMGNRPLANADTGRTFPPEISKPGGGGW